MKGGEDWTRVVSWGPAGGGVGGGAGDVWW